MSKIAKPLIIFEAITSFDIPIIQEKFFFCFTGWIWKCTKLQFILFLIIIFFLFKIDICESPKLIKINLSGGWYVIYSHCGLTIINEGEVITCMRAFVLIGIYVVYLALSILAIYVRSITRFEVKSHGIKLWGWID